MTIIPRTSAQLANQARHFTAAVLCLALAACGFNLLGDGGPPARLFDISPVRNFSGLPHFEGNLLVAEFESHRYMDTDRIAIRGRNNEIQYIAGVRWSDRAPRMIQTMLITSLERAEITQIVARQGAEIRGALLLEGEIRAFEVRQDDESVLVRMQVTLVDATRLKPLAARVVEVESPLSSMDAISVVGAFDTAMQSVARTIVEWTASGAAAQAQNSPNRDS